MSYISKGSIECGILYQFERYLNGTVGLPALPIIFSVALLGHLTCGVRYCRAASFLPGALVLFAIFSAIGHCINIGVHTVGSIAPIVLPVGAEVGCFVGGLVVSAFILWRSPLRAPLVLTGAFAGVGTIFMIFMIAGAANKSIDYVTRAPRDVYPQYLRLCFGIAGMLAGAVAGYHVRARYIWFVAAAVSCSAFVSALAFSIGQFNGCQGLWQLSHCAESNAWANYNEQGAAVATGVVLLLFFCFLGAGCQIYWVVVIQRRLLAGCKVDGTPSVTGLERVPSKEEGTPAAAEGSPSKAPYGDTPKHRKHPSTPPGDEVGVSKETSSSSGAVGDQEAAEAQQQQQQQQEQRKKRKRFFRLPCLSADSSDTEREEREGSDDPHTVVDATGAAVKSPPPEIHFGSGGSPRLAGGGGGAGGAGEEPTFDIVVPSHRDVVPTIAGGATADFSTHGATSVDGLVVQPRAEEENNRRADDDRVETDCFGRVKKPKKAKQQAHAEHAGADAARPEPLNSNAMQHLSPLRVVASPAIAFGGGRAPPYHAQFPPADSGRSDTAAAGRGPATTTGPSAGTGAVNPFAVATYATPLRPHPATSYGTAGVAMPSAAADVGAFGGSAFDGSAHAATGPQWPYNTGATLRNEVTTTSGGPLGGSDLQTSPVSAAVQETPFMGSLASAP